MTQHNNEYFAPNRLANNPHGSSCAQEITQAELAEFQRLRNLEKETKEKLTRLRKSLVVKLEARRSVEPGSLMVFLEVQESRRFSRDRLVRLLGEQAVQQLQDQIEPSITNRIIVREWR